MSTEKLVENPVLKANIVSRVCFCWVTGFFRLGAKRELELNDMYAVIPVDTSKSLGDRLSKNWKNELDNVVLKNADGKQKEYVPSLLKAIVRLFWKDCVKVGLLALFEECVTRIAQPLFLGCLIQYFSNSNVYHFTRLHAYLFATGIVVTAIMYTFTHHPFFFGVCHIGMQIRVACCSLVYRKAVKLSHMSLGETTIGQMVNLLSNDVNRFEQCVIYMPYLVVGPIQIAITTAILWYYFGPSCLVGVFVLVCFAPFQGYTGKLFSKLRTSTATKTDKRIRIMNEIVSGMQVIKYYTWEKPFSDLVAEARNDEVKVIRKTAFLRAVNMSLFYTSSKIIIFLTLLTYVLVDIENNRLTAEKVFVTLSLYNNIRLVMTLFFPSAIAQVAETLVSIRRLKEFLLLQEKDEPTWSSHSPNGGDGNEKSDKKDVSILMENFSAKWNSTYDENTLSDINLKVANGELVTVIGPVGAGKSSLLYAMMNELPKTAGTVEVHGSIAYASQEAWVYSGSVKHNILFGKEYDSIWYDQVVEACALKRDFTLLPHGDNSLVGDRGTSLSGGQKARINLARAVYANADVYFLDDPLSAVDASVSRHLFEKCINGILKNKIRILVTHQLQYLKNQNHILLFNSGKVEILGTFDELLKSGINFTHLLQNPQALEAKSGNASTIGSTVFKSFTPPTRLRTGSTSSTGSLIINHQTGFDIGESALLGLYPHDVVISTSLEDVNEDKELSRTLSQSKSRISIKDDIEEVEFIPKQAEEKRGTGTIDSSLYGTYFRAGTGCWGLLWLGFTGIIAQVLFTASDYWLNFWTTTEENRTYRAMNRTKLNITNDEKEPLERQRDVQLGIYSAIVFALFVFSMIRTVKFFSISMNSSVHLHQAMFQGIIRAPMKFFETNPVGRILNRFSKDIGQMDDALPPNFFDALGILLSVIGILAIIAYVNPILIAPAAVLFFVFYFLRRFYLKTARSVKRLEGVARSPVFSHLSTTLYGLSTIRAFKTQDEFIKQFDDHQDLHTSTWYIFLASTRWFGVLLDWISTFFIAAVTYSFMFSSSTGSEVGLAISSAMTLSGMFQWGVRQSAEVENQMVSVERVLEYTKITPEAELESLPGNRPPRTWPANGEIIMNHMQLQYGDDRPVLNDITCTFHPAEKVGIVGRTGAGKSSMISSLFRLAEPTGDIIIDGINILDIGLHDLRSKIAIIPQDPVLFTGTLRKNLDPFNNFNDVDIWNVLEEVHLAEDIRQVPAGISVEVTEGGSNFSVGQRQLVCLGRAILRQNKILVLDEATANVDPETDALIQQTIRKKFVACTVLTIAHRLNTVMDSDRILVLDAGRIKEFGVPYELLQDQNSALYALVKETGKTNAEALIKISKLAAIKRKIV